LNKVYKTRLEMAHDIASYEDKLLSFSSIRGLLIDLSTNEILYRVTEDPVFLRGLSITNEYIYIGRSGVVPHNKRSTANGAVDVLDAKTFSVIKTIRAPFVSQGNIYCVRVLDEEDIAHYNRIMGSSEIESILGTYPSVLQSYQSGETTAV
ncbi:MAG: hypothetical protein D6710_01770, partial [Nitrospirae bacterium]